MRFARGERAPTSKLKTTALTSILVCSVSREAPGKVIKGLDGEYLGKPSHPEAPSLSVDWLPALFADTEAYPRP